MLRKITLAAVVVIGSTLFSSAAMATTCASYAYTLTNGTTADASQVMGNFNDILTCANTYLAPLAGPHFTGSVGIGTSTPAKTLDVNGTVGIGTTSASYLTANYNGDLLAGMDSGGYYYASGGFTDSQLPIFIGYRNNRIVFNTGTAGTGYERVRITNTGAVGVGTTSPAYPLDVVGDIRTSSCLRYNSGTTGTCTSDIVLKRGVAPFSLGLDAIAGLRPVNFFYNGLGGNPDDGRRQIGLIAQGVEKVAPRLVGTQLVYLHPTDGKMTAVETVDYGALTYMLINAVKELKATSDRQSAEIARLQRNDRQMAAAVRDQAAAIADLRAEIAALRRGSRLKTAAR